MHTVSRIRQVLNERSTQAAVFSFFLLILGAELCSYSTSIFELENSRFEQIHTIGSQQIIAHRMVKDITLLANDPDDASVYSQLDADLTRFSQQHQNLLNSTPSDQASTEILNHQISPLVLQLTQKISQVLSGSQPASTVLNSILIEEKHLLPALARYQSTLISEHQLLSYHDQERQVISLSLIWLCMGTLIVLIWWYVRKTAQNQYQGPSGIRHHHLQTDRESSTESELLLSKVGEVGKIGGWHLNLKNQELFWTAETYVIHEVEPDFKPTLENAIEFYPPDIRPQIQSAVKNAINAGQSWDLKLPFITAKGRHIWVRAQGELEYQNNKPVRLVGAFQDITREKQLEAEFTLLQDHQFSTRAQLESVIRAATEISIIATDTEGLITLFSPGAERLLGYSAEEMIGIKTLLHFHQTSELEQRSRELTVTLGKKTDGLEVFFTPARDDTCDKHEWTYICKDGTERIVELTVTVIRGKQNQIDGYLGIAIDVTQKKIQEQQLFESHEKIKHLIDALPAAAYTCDNTGLITYYNQAAAEFWGCEPELNSPDYRFCGSVKMFDSEGNSLAHEDCWMSVALKNREIYHCKEIVIECENGNRKTALAHVSPITNFEGDMIGAINVVVDISDRIALENSLRETTARLELCLKVLDQHAIVAETELNGVIRHVNDMFCKVSGYEREETIGQTHRIVNSGLHPKEFWQNVFKTISTVGMWQGEICNRRKNGELYWLDTTIAAMKDGEGKATGYLAIRNDITELRLAQEAALAASHSKSEFLANMSHEIRTPLTAILGFAELLRNDHEFASSAGKREQAVKTIQEAGNHLLTVINDILDLSKIEAGKVEIEKTSTQLFNILDHIESLLRPPAIEKGVELVTRIETPLPDLIETDSTRLRQILMNLVGNAVKFTDKGRIQIKVKFLEENESRFLKFEIEDSGPGMSDRQAAKMFMAFSQADTSVTRQHGGTGLGLVISRKLARLMGGDVSLAWTEPGKGTCFRVMLPVGTFPETRYTKSRFQEKHEQTDKKSPTATIKLPAHTRILLAEDGPDNQRLICFLLKKMGAEVDVADNGVIACQKFLEAETAGEPYDLLLTDMQMPEMDGYTLARNFRESGATLPIIALTAHAMSDDRQKCLNAGCDDYISKPINSRILGQTILHWLILKAEKKIEPPSPS
ncbi:PAS domain-containing hybrid sensor histidine kinase/response regulator [Gimesia maris]|uniref:PAS domain-containing hybrid sensor histidine kinase/response regulator n=1 Tax=Gimesia maris TaxID=122 RepID=UPI0032F08BEC